MPEKAMFFQVVFNLIENVLAVGLLFKIVISCIVYKIKRHTRTTPQFWMYLFFSISFLCYSLCRSLVIHPAVQNTIEGHINPMTLIYFQNIFFSGSLLYLQLYIYKTVTFVNTEDLYTGTTANKRKKLKRLQNVAYTTVAIEFLLQTVMIGMTPYFFTSSRVSPEIVTTLCILEALVASVWITVDSGVFTKVIKVWVYYVLLSAFIVPISYLLNLFNVMFLFMENGFIYAALLRAPFLALRAIQFFLLLFVIATRRDLGVLYD